MSDYQSKEQAAAVYAEMKQRQSLGNFNEADLLIMRFAFMAGYDAGKRVSIIADTSVVPNSSQIDPTQPDHNGERVV